MKCQILFSEKKKNVIHFLSAELAQRVVKVKNKAVFFQCLEVIKTGLSDPEVRPSRRFLLYQRAEKICTAPSSKFSSKLADIEPVKVTESPEVRTYILPIFLCTVNSHYLKLWD